MVEIESWLDSNSWKINKRDLKKFSKYENIVERQQNRLDENEIKNIVSKCILNELGEKVYNLDLSIQLSKNISKNIRKELSDKYKFYKIIIQTFVGKMSNEKIQNLDSHSYKLYASYCFDQRTDKCLSMIQNNGQVTVNEVS
ncbi:unnamed protein product [Rotaria sp. Silwood1]|nr:unnamed protein product [Rotaria sp. Silwood1]CAF1157073.1 unnamed protein product [Rotaria sp. Silwood1]CAF4572856.1 unnamed protein product [Rotaria sp. Silwood1]CAF4583903.1 unnamed protein product [Rotaria sp. Silwood1]CAF4605712.1 unnamed protein product [Rotaria sp. Silwood1]